MISRYHRCLKKHKNSKQWFKAVSGLVITILLLTLTACQDKPANYPHGKHDPEENVYFTSFAEQPKTLDPAKSYSADEAIFTAQIYEPPLQYNYLKRPYALEPLTLTSMPSIKFIDQKGQLIKNLTHINQVAYTEYTFHLKPDIYYQPHPAFAKNKNGEYAYWQTNPLQADAVKDIKAISDFKLQGTRALKAQDYILGIKRLAAPWNHSPIYGLMAKHIRGFKDFHQQLSQAKDHHLQTLMQHEITGVKLVNDHMFTITVNGYYPQFLYWLAMPFFAPMPQEVLAFYEQKALQDKNIGLEWYPVGTGAYMLTKNDPNYEMVLAKNPYYHDDFFPQPESKEDEKFTFYTGKKLPFVDKFIFKLEKESIPRWHKFLQGYYDQSAIGSEQFQQAIMYDKNGKPEVSEALAERNIHLSIDTQPSIFYLGFNMKDPVVGGYSAQAKKLRQAISIAIDYEEYINLFMNGRAMIAHGPIPPDLLHGDTTINPITHVKINDKVKRHSLKTAQQLLKEAGYPNGVDLKTGKQLALTYTAVTGGGPEQRAQFDWLRKQFAKLGITLHIESTHYSRFQDKIRHGDVQLFFFGWSADYPDPENFLFLLYGANSKVISGGENATNYQNSEYDKLFLQLQKTQNKNERQVIIAKMLKIVREDAPWVWGFHQQVFQLSHAWVAPRKMHGIANNTLKYIALEPTYRQQMQKKWNQPYFGAIIIIGIILLVFIIPGIFLHYKKERKQPKKYQ